MVVDKVGGRLYLEMVKERDRPTLDGIVEKHAEKGTRIFSDCWKAYNTLSSNGFVHFTVNHKECFVNHQHIEVVEEVPLDELPSDIAEDAEDIILIDDTVDAHTNKIERCWREVKRGLLNQPSTYFHETSTWRCFVTIPLAPTSRSETRGTLSFEPLPSTKKTCKNSFKTRSKCFQIIKMVVILWFVKLSWDHSKKKLFLN